MVTHSQGHSWSLVCTFRHDNYTQILTKGESEKVRQKNRVGNVVGVGTHSRELPGKQTRKPLVINAEYRRQHKLDSQLNAKRNGGK